MGLDLYIANSLAGSAKSKFFTSLDSQVHASVMRYVSTGDFPLLSKMADYLSDTSYEQAEVSALLDELTNLKMIIPPTSSIHKNIDGLLTLIRKALELRSGLFAVSD